MNKDKVFFYFKASIFDKLPNDIRDKVAIAGGAVRDMLVGADIKDVDMFVQDAETEAKLMSFFKENGKEGKVNGFLANYTFGGKWIQVIRGRYYDLSTTELIDTFDFTICQAMVTVDGIRVGEHFWESVSTKHLRIHKITYPLSTLERMQKYIKRGYSACNGTILEIAKAINAMESEVFDPNSNVKENQLVFYPDGSPRFLGVD